MTRLNPNLNPNNAYAHQHLALLQSTATPTSARQVASSGQITEAQYKSLVGSPISKADIALAKKVVGAAREELAAAKASGVQGPELYRAKLNVAVARQLLSDVTLQRQMEHALRPEKP